MTVLKGKRAVYLFLAAALVFLVAATPASNSSQVINTVVIDAGHGGKDPGNLGTGRYKQTEKQIALNVALKLGKKIESTFPDVKVVYTRKDDTFLKLNERVEVASKAKADLFISIHCDAFTKSSANGSGTYVMGMHKNEESLRVAMQENASIYLEEDYETTYGGFDPKDPDTYIALTLRQNVYLDHSLSLAQKVQKQFRDAVGRKDRGVKQAGFYVISFTTMPSILVELGFLTNPGEEDFLRSSAGQEKMSSAIFDAFKHYKVDIEGIQAAIRYEAEEEAPQPEEPGGGLLVEDVANNIHFKIQILTSSKALEKGSPELMGLEEVEELKVRRLYKYFAGRTTSFDAAKKNQQHLRELGFKDAFVVAFQGKEQVGLADAIRKTK